MLTANLQRIAGVVMLVLVVALIAALFTANTPDTDAGKFPADFQDVVDNEVTYLLGQAIQVAVGGLVAVLGAALYTFFRSRDRFLALLGFTGFLLMSVLFVVSSVAYVTTHEVAEGEAIADETTVQEIGRALVELGDGAFFLGILFFALGLLAFGAVILATRTDTAFADTALGEPWLAPPSWLGWLPIAAGVFYLIGWLAVFAEAFFIATIVGFLLTILWYATFGVWMLRGRPAIGTALGASVGA